MAHKSPNSKDHGTLAKNPTVDSKGSDLGHDGDPLWPSRFLVEPAEHQRNPRSIKDDNAPHETMPLWRQVRQEAAETERILSTAGHQCYSQEAMELSV